MLKYRDWVFFLHISNLLDIKPILSSCSSGLFVFIHLSLPVCFQCTMSPESILELAALEKWQDRHGKYMCVSTGLVHACWTISRAWSFVQTQPAVCVATPAHFGSSRKPTWLAGVGIPLLITWPALTISSTGQKSGPRHVLLLASHVRPVWAIHVIERKKATSWGVFPSGSSCVLLRAALPARTAFHLNFATTFLDIFLECLFRLFQILLADSGLL